MYINEALEHGQEENNVVTDLLENIEHKHHILNESAKDITALTLQLKKFNKNVHKKKIDQKYKWKYTPPKSGESSTKLIKDRGVKKTYYWWTYHNQWSRHKPFECKNLPIKPREQRRADQQRKEAYMEAKAALQELNFSSDEETEWHTNLFDDADSDSNTSDSTEYFSDYANSNTS